MTLTRHPQRIWAAAFGLSWAIDLLFWNSNPGISFTIWIALVLAGLFLSAFWEGRRPAWPSYLLSFVTLVLALTNTVRDEPFSRIYTSVLAMACLGLLAMTLTNGNWLFYRVGDYLLTALKIIGSAITRGVYKPPVPAPAEGASETPTPQKAKNIWHTLLSILPYLRGIILAIPVLLVLGLLLSSADPVFGERMRSLLSVIDFKNIPEYIFRLFYIVFLGYLFAGLLLDAAAPLNAEKRPNPQEAWNLRFLGSTEAFVVLGAVLAMFGFFLVLQFQYLFGGQANITSTGYTYADYARRGFFELVWVAILSIALYLGLATVTKRNTPQHQLTFGLLSIGLLGMVLLILVSALQRMLLYEDAYGFTRLRVYTHIFIFWLMFLLLAGIVLEALRRPGHFGLATLIFVAGFGLTFTCLNLDGTITSLNIQRARTGKTLDIHHLIGLSADAVPILVQTYTNPAEPEAIRARSGAALACLTSRLKLTTPQHDWRGYNLSQANASQSLKNLDLQSFYVNGDRGLQVQVDDITVNCWDSSD